MMLNVNLTTKRHDENDFPACLSKRAATKPRFDPFFLPFSDIVKKKFAMVDLIFYPEPERIVRLVSGERVLQNRSNLRKLHEC